MYEEFRDVGIHLIGWRCFVREYRRLRRFAKSRGTDPDIFI